MHPAQSSDARVGTVAIIGAGSAGRDFASTCLAAGLHVVLEDVMPANLRRAQADLDAPAGRLTLVSTVEDAVRNADLAIDFVPDELESKLEIFSMIDRMAPPRTLLRTPTETLSITDLASCTYRPDRCMAVSGLNTSGSPSSAFRVSLLFPAAVSPATRSIVQQFFISLGVSADLVADPRASMLTARPSPYPGGAV